MFSTLTPLTYADYTERSVNIPLNSISLEQRIYELINASRKQGGVFELELDESLSYLAREHSKEMARYGFFSHEGPDGDLLTRARRNGLNRWRSLGENIAYNQGYKDPAIVALEGWMNSEGHRLNLLRSGFTHTGIGVAFAPDGRVYITQVFGAR